MTLSWVKQYFRAYPPSFIIIGSIIPSNNPDNMEIVMLSEKKNYLLCEKLCHIVLTDFVTVRVNKMELIRKNSESNFKCVSIWKELHIANVQCVISVCYNYYKLFFFPAIDPCQRDDGGCPSNSTVCNYLQPGKVWTPSFLVYRLCALWSNKLFLKVAYVKPPYERLIDPFYKIFIVVS